MFSSFSRVRSALAAAAVGAFLSPAAPSPMAFAADMPLFAPEPVNEEPIEFGSGWYLRGDIGAAHVNVRDIDGVNLSQSFPNNFNLGLGGGYQFNNWFRTDVTFDYQSINDKTGPNYVFAPCQIGAVGTPEPGPYIGSTPVYAGCSPFVRSRVEAITTLANAYLDLGNWGGFTPYLGVGAGFNVLYQKAQVNWFTGNLTPYANTTWTDPFTLATHTANWDRAHTGTTLRLAYALMAGVAYDLTDHMKLDLGYRWSNLGSIQGSNLYGARIKKDLSIHQLRVGFRYVID